MNAIAKLSCGVTASLLFVGVIAPVLQLLGNSLFPKRIVESLENPTQIVGWHAAGLTTLNGGRIPLPQVPELPTSSVALAAATQRGVELRPDGRVFGLVRIHHWCGNDPVREHVARVDLSHMLLYLGNQPVEAPDSDLAALRTSSGESEFSEHGWRIGDFLQFQLWSDHAASNGV